MWGAWLAALVISRRARRRDVMAARPKRPKRPPQPDHYFEVDLLPAERDLILAALRALDQGGIKQARKALIDKVETATRIALPLSRFDWDAVDAECARSRRSLADLIWDESRGGKDPL